MGVEGVDFYFSLTQVCRGSWPFKIIINTTFILFILVLGRGDLRCCGVGGIHFLIFLPLLSGGGGLGTITVPVVTLAVLARSWWDLGRSLGVSSGLTFLSLARWSILRLRGLLLFLTILMRAGLPWLVHLGGVAGLALAEEVEAVSMVENKLLQKLQRAPIERHLLQLGRERPRATFPPSLEIQRLSKEVVEHLVERDVGPNEGPHPQEAYH